MRLPKVKPLEVAAAALLFLFFSIPSRAELLRPSAAMIKSLNRSNERVGRLLSEGRRPHLPDTLKVLALRVQFIRDSLKTTTGDGTFDLSHSDEYLIDRPPHDRIYFEHQLLA
ncbi:MAG: hypothetical protein ONA69_09400, partial [candidate division KSB1 bacterium]|nr:hypothetical protein [candidate division KSB1 bacterium]